MIIRELNRELEGFRFDPNHRPSSIAWAIRSLWTEIKKGIAQVIVIYIHTYRSLEEEIVSIVFHVGRCNSIVEKFPPTDILLVRPNNTTNVTRREKPGQEKRFWREQGSKKPGQGERFGPKESFSEYYYVAVFIHKEIKEINVY